MNWNISAWSIKNPIPPIVLFLLLSVAGIGALISLGIEEEPNIDVPWVTVYVTESGAAPTELETQVTRLVEDAVAGTTGVKHVHSTVTTGASVTSIEFELGTNSDRAMTEVREAVTRIRAQLPRGIDEPTVQRDDYDSGSSIAYTISSSKRSPVELSWLADNDVTRALMACPNIGHVWRFGGVDRQITVKLDPVRLEAYGITADMVNQQLRGLNINLPGGRGNVAAAEESIRTIGSAPTLQKLQSTRIMLPAGRWVELRSLGTVADEVGERRHIARLNGESVVSCDIVRRKGKNIVDVEKDAERVLASLSQRFPDLKFTRVYSDAKYVKESCSATFESLILGALLAVVVIWLFLRDGRAALISACAMPLSVIPTFAFMKWMNFTLNDMSMLGLALVIGILVDDAIVEIENIVRHMNLGKTPFKAAIEAADEIGLAVVATTLAAVVVFLPVAFMGGIPGQFFRQFGLTVAVAVFCSLLVARLVTPLMAAYWLKPHKGHSEKIGPVGRFYDKALSVALQHRLVTVLAGLMFFGGSVALFKSMPTSLVSRIDKGESSITVELPPGSQLKDTLEIVERIDRIVKARPEVETVFDKIGGDGGINIGRVQITLVPKDKRALSQDQFEAALRPELATIPGAHITFNGGWGSGQVQMMLTGYDSAVLDETASKLVREMRTIPQLTDIHSSTGTLTPEIVVRPDFARAAEQGVSVESIARTALVATMGDIDANRPKFDLNDRQIPIIVELDPKFRNKMSVIGNLKVSGNGKLVPLSSVAKVSIDSGLFKIERYDRARRVYIHAKFGADFTLGEALKAVHSLPAFVNRPASVKDNVTGDAEVQSDIFGGFGYAIITGVLLIYAVLVLLFKGFLQPFTIMMSLPLSLGGAVIGLWSLGKPIDMYALIGIVMLMGLVTKNAILLVEYCLTAMNSGMTRTDAIFTAGRTRMRPILMTTTAMIAGMLPIAIGLGAGAEARAPMAIAVVGGLFMSTLLTLVVVPVVFTYMDDLQRFIRQLFPKQDVQSPEANEHSEKSPAQITLQKLHKASEAENSQTVQQVR